MFMWSVASCNWLPVNLVPNEGSILFKYIVDNYNYTVG